MKTRSILIALAVVTVLICSIVYGGADPITIPDIPIPDKSGPTYKVVRIVDGDTIVIIMNRKDTKVRLIGVDTPETVDPRKPVEKYGKEAAQFTTNLLLGEDVWVENEPSNTVDKYGRSLYYIYRAPDGLFVNLEIVRQGYGHAYTTYPFKYMELFRYYERKAMESGKGLWGAPAPTQESNQNGVTSDIKDGTQQQPDDTIVYITKTGGKYHRDGCRYLARSKIPIKKSDAIKQGYTPCSVCKP